MQVASYAKDDLLMSGWTASFDKFDLQNQLRALPIPASAVQKPQERVDEDATTENWGLWPTIKHTAMGDVRVDGQPVHMSATDWQSTRGGPCLGEHNEDVLTRLLGYSTDDVQDLKAQGVL